MELSKRDIEGIANKRINHRYFWWIVGFGAPPILTLAILTIFVPDGIPDTIPMPTRYVIMIAFFIPWLVGAALWSRVQKREVETITQQYEANPQIPIQTLEYEMVSHAVYRLAKFIIIVLSKTIFRHHKFRWERIKANNGT